MNVKELKKLVQEALEVVKECPESLQSVCFDALLRDALARAIQPKDAPAVLSELGGKDTRKGEPPPAKQEEFALGDLHVKVKRFLQKASLDIAQVNNVFYKEGGKAIPLYTDLHTTRVSESQVRIALLLCLQTALDKGDFECQVGEVRQECRDRKCYDEANFAANLQKRKELFTFDRYDKSTTKLALSDAGKDALATVIKDLQ